MGSRLKNHRGLESSSLFYFLCCYIPLISNSKSISLAAPVFHRMSNSVVSPSSSATATTTAARTFSAVQMLEYMQRFGYLDEGPADVGALYSESAVSDALKTVQKFGALPQTGVLDGETIKLMTSPRCGVADISRPKTEEQGSFYRISQNSLHRRRHRRFVVGARPWIKRRITYFLVNWSPQVGEQEMAQDMRTAFDEWAKYGNLKFVRVFTPDADIIVGFGSHYHGDNYPFDGPGNILAHAYYPYEMGHYGGDIHFDNDETWTRNATEGGEINFLSVAVHELGHSLGLGHSPSHNSIMFPYYKAATTSSSRSGHHLGYDDVLAMYNLYIRANLPAISEDGDEESETTAPTAAENETTPTSSSRADIDEDYATTERIWPGITEQETTSAEPPTTIGIPATAAAAPNNVTYHFHGDYETVAAHKKRFNYPETTPAARTTMVTSSSRVNWRRTSLFPNRPSLFPGPTPTTTNSDWNLMRNNNNNNNSPTDPSRGTTISMRSRDEARVGSYYASQGVANDLCLGNFEAATSISDHLFIFKNKLVWRLDANLFPVRGYPISISRLFPSEEDEGDSRIDAAYQRQTDGAVVLFSGHRFWTMNETDFQLRLEDEQWWKSPVEWHTIWELGFPVTVTRIDAVFVWPKNKKTYFFTGDLFWRFDEVTGRMDQGYPMSINRWHGIPFHINAVVTLPGWEGNARQTVFFKNNSYWLFNDHWVRPALGYPRLISTLFNC